LIYLDNASTAFPKAPGVAEAVAASIRELPGSAGRASHGYAIAASEKLYDVRLALGRFFGMRDPERLVFTRNATEALNLAILGTVRPGDRVVASPFEHNAVMRPLRELERRDGVVVEAFPCSSGGTPDLDALAAMLDAGPCGLLVLCAAGNVSGAVLPLPGLISLAHDRGVPVLVDGSQLAGHRRVDFERLGADYFAFSGHKGLLGPAGTGGLCLAAGSAPRPLFFGGTGSASASELQPDFLPDRYEAGTHNLAALSGLRVAVEFLEAAGIEAVEARERELRGRLARGFAALDGLRIVGCDREEEAVPVLSVLPWPGLPSMTDIAAELDARGIAVRMGLQCAPAAHRQIGTFASGGTLRFSPGYFTTEADIDEALGAMEEILS
jgi:cysteine desulfurase family protein